MYNHYVCESFTYNNEYKRKKYNTSTKTFKLCALAGWDGDHNHHHKIEYGLRQLYFMI